MAGSALGICKWCTCAILVLSECVLSFITLLVGLPESLLEIEDLACLKSVEVLLLGQLLVECLNSLLESVSIAVQLQLLLQLLALLGLSSDLCLLLVKGDVEVADLLLLLDEKLLELLEVRGASGG